jgi:hypothetical protein
MFVALAGIAQKHGTIPNWDLDGLSKDNYLAACVIHSGVSTGFNKSSPTHTSEKSGKNSHAPGKNYSSPAVWPFSRRISPYRQQHDLNEQPAPHRKNHRNENWKNKTHESHSPSGNKFTSAH